MSHTSTYIPPLIAQKIKDAAKLYDTAADYVQLKKSGISHVGVCPKCGGKKLTITDTTNKTIWKCFTCDIGGDNAVSFLMKTQDMEFPVALRVLADRYHIPIEEEGEKKKVKKRDAKMKFRDLQLRESGIPNKAQVYWFSSGAETKYEMDRYQSASVDKAMNVTPDGDDMVLHYLDLEGKPVIYKAEGSRSRSLVRVRWANPSLHTDKNGRPIKYKSPYGSGSHLWFPMRILEAYKKFETVKTLYITEGEKKADKMCLHGMMTVGVMGISNFANGGEMPYQFELLIKRCSIKQVVFVLDADWQELSTKDPSRSVDSRPNIFYKAVLRFRDYFYAYHISGIDLKIFFAYGKDIVHKGMDDLLVYGLKKKEDELANDFIVAMAEREGKGKYVNCHNITQMSSYQMKKFWNLESKPKFLEHHKDYLRTLKEFKFGQLKYRWEPQSASFEMIDKIRPHEQYWNEVYAGENKKTGKEIWKHTFDYVAVHEFLKKQGLWVI